MLVFLLACIVSFIPCTALFFWLRNRKPDPAYRKLCDSALIKGILSVFLIVLVSAVNYFLLRLIKLHENNPLLYEMIYNFIVLAMAEEFVKYRTFRKVLEKTDYPYSWADVTVLMTVVSIGFSMIESVTYAIGASVPVVLVRGICLPHAGYGFIVGYFFGKSLKTGKPGDKWFGLILAWLIHGLYDFSLSDSFMALNDNLVFVPFILALLDILLVVNLIVFLKKAEKRQECTEPLISHPEETV